MADQLDAPAVGIKPITTAMLIYPGMTMLDMAGPQCVLGLHGQTYFAWKTLDPIVSDSGVSINPNATYESCPRDVDVLFVPGATNNHWLMKDEETLAFLADIGQTARYITSVCTGSLLLGAAGLLDGYQSACHWAYMDILRELGIDAQDDRVVRDRNRFSGGGVTAGIDFGLTMLAELRGEPIAKMTQLGIQYDPEPPYNVGLPHLAGPETTKMMTDLLDPFLTEGKQIAADVRRERASVAAA